MANGAFNSFGGVPGDPMEEVLALQSYSLFGGGVEDCPSQQSIVVVCPSSISGVDTGMDIGL